MLRKHKPVRQFETDILDNLRLLPLCRFFSILTQVLAGIFEKIQFLPDSILVEGNAKIA